MTSDLEEILGGLISEIENQVPGSNIRGMFDEVEKFGRFNESLNSAKGITHTQMGGPPNDPVFLVIVEDESYLAAVPAEFEGTKIDKMVRPSITIQGE